MKSSCVRAGPQRVVALHDGGCVKGYPFMMAAGRAVIN